MFAEKAEKALLASNRLPALPLDGLEAGLLSLRPFRVSGQPPDLLEGPSLPSSSPSSIITSPSPIPEHQSFPYPKVGRENGDASLGDTPPRSQSTSSSRAGIGIMEAGTEASNGSLQQDKYDSNTSLSQVAEINDTPPAGRGGIKPCKVISDDRTATDTGWTCARLRLASRSRTASRADESLPQPTMWGGIPITPFSMWDWAGNESKEGLVKDGDQTQISRHFIFHNVDSRTTSPQMAEFMSGEFFRTADGQPLFFEIVGTTGNTGLVLKKEWDRGGTMSDLLGDEGCKASPVAESKRLGLKARLRRKMIDTRRRDTKRRKERLSARGRVERLEDEVTPHPKPI